MYRIGIIGNSPEYFSNPSSVKDNLERVLDLVRFQYGEELVFNLAGDIGVGEWAADVCLKKKYRYHLFLPYPVKEMEVLWYPEQLKAVQNHFKTAWATTISFPDFVPGEQRECENYHNLVDSSAFVICFWNGMRQGNTADAIRYSLSQHKLVVNGLNDLKLVTSEDIGK